MADEARAPERRAALATGAASIVLVLGLWELSAQRGWVSPVLLPPPSQIAGMLWEILGTGEFAEPLATTLTLLFLGYATACILGIGLGLLMGCSRAGYGLLEPLVELVRPLPKPALVPALFLFLGIGPKTMFTVVVLAVVFPVLINTLAGVRGIDPVLLETARTFGCGRLRTVFRVVLPAAAPFILAGMRTGLGLGLVLVVLAEMLAGESGLGFLILDLQRAFRLPEMYAWLAILAALGAGLAVLFDLAERIAVPWRGRQ